MATADVIDTETFTHRVCDAIVETWGDDPGAAKRVAHIARSSVETAKNWFKRRCAPSGPNLVMLMRESERLTEVILDFAGKTDLAERQAEILHRLDRVDNVLRYGAAE
ncbi:MAG: hypothetical protein AB7P02_05200 [Alphaproteobacteria bacterium]